MGVGERGDERVELVDLFDKGIEHLEIGDNDASSAAASGPGGPFGAFAMLRIGTHGDANAMSALHVAIEIVERRLRLGSK